MFYILAILYILTYSVGVGRAAFRYLNARNIVMLISDFSAAYGNERKSYHPKESAYQQSLTTMLRNAPIIAEMIRYPKLSYKDDTETTFEKAESIRKELQMKVNEYRIQLYRSLNPFRTAKEIVVLPLSAVKECGFAPKPFAAITVTILGWLISYLLSMFQPEIKELLVSIFQQLIHV